MKNSFNKKLILLVASVFFFSLLLVFGANRITAQETQPAATTYELLAPLPGYVDSGSGSGTTAAQYIQGIFRLVIALAGALAVLTIIFGGIKYMSTDAFGGKNEAKEIISRALWGFVLAIGAWMILYTISPGENNPFVNFNLSLERQEIPENQNTPNSSGVTPGPGLPPIRTGVRPGYTLTPEQVDQDMAIRNRLGGTTVPVYVENPPCVNGGIRGCTNVVGLPENAITGIMNLAEDCMCQVIVTGGTEGGHRTHGPNLPIVDLSRRMDTLNRHITQNGTVINPPTQSCSRLGTQYRLDGAIYVNEGTHWHVCY